jgi:hypothetical protein
VQPDDAPHVEWGRGFLADRATRAIAPAIKITAAELEKRAKERAGAAVPR